MTSIANGNLIIGESGGATAVINASMVGAFEAAGADKRIQGIYGMRFGAEGLLREDLIDLRRQPTSLWQKLRYTPSAALGSSHYKLTDEDVEHIVDILRRYNIRYFLYIGGNGSAKTVHRLLKVAQQADYDLCAISVPKTIDNDLPHTDHCPGYGTAARFMAQATMDSTMNALTMPSEHLVKVIEAQGRNVGWLTAASALGKRQDDDSPQVLLVPEHRFNEEHFLKRVEEVYRQLGFAVVVTSVAILDEAGHPLGSNQNEQEQPGVDNTAQYLVQTIQQHLQVKSRFDKFGDLQWSSISRTDQEEAYLVGWEGTNALLRGESDKMVTLVRDATSPYRCTSGLVDLAQVVDQQRTLPDEYLDASKLMVTPAFYDYALPLLGEPLPLYPKLELIKVEQ